MSSISISYLNSLTKEEQKEQDKLQKSTVLTTDIKESDWTTVFVDHSNGKDFTGKIYCSMNNKGNLIIHKTEILK